MIYTSQCPSNRQLLLIIKPILKLILSSFLGLLAVKLSFKPVDEVIIKFGHSHDPLPSISPHNCLPTITPIKFISHVSTIMQSTADNFNKPYYLPT
jgi:hypothetical protein